MIHILPILRLEPASAGTVIQQMRIYVPRCYESSSSNINFLRTAHLVYTQIISLINTTLPSDESDALVMFHV